MVVAHVSSHHSHENEWRDRLCNERVTARIERFFTRVGIDRRGYSEKRGVARRRIRPQHARELRPVDLRQHEIEQDDTGAARLRDRESIEARACFLNNESERFEHDAFGHPRVVVILRDEHDVRGATAARRHSERREGFLTVGCHAGGGASACGAVVATAVLSDVARGSRSVNSEPRPTVLATVSWPCMPLANSRLIAKPSPVPPYRSSNGVSSWTYGSKISRSLPESMPGPLSATRKLTPVGSAEQPSVTTPPRCENFTALAARLTRICFSLSPSAATNTPVQLLTCSVTPWSVASGAITDCVMRSTSSAGTGPM